MVIIKVGQILVNKIIENIMSVPLEPIFENIKELAKELMKNFSEDSIKWFSNSIQNVPLDCMTNKEKEKLTETIRYFNEDKMDAILLNFVRRCLSKSYRMRSKM